MEVLKSGGQCQYSKFRKIVWGFHGPGWLWVVGNGSRGYLPIFSTLNPQHTCHGPRPGPILVTGKRIDLHISQLPSTRSTNIESNSNKHHTAQHSTAQHSARPSFQRPSQLQPNWLVASAHAMAARPVHCATTKSFALTRSSCNYPLLFDLQLQDDFALLYNMFYTAIAHGPSTRRDARPQTSYTNADICFER